MGIVSTHAGVSMAPGAIAPVENAGRRDRRPRKECPDRRTAWLSPPARGSILTERVNEASTGPLAVGACGPVSGVQFKGGCTMRAPWSVALGLVVVFAFVAGLQGQDKGKEVTLKGTILCGKCELKETKQCANAIRVKEGGKEVVYYFDDSGKGEKYHKDICQTPKEGTVTGTVTEKDGKKMIK